VRALRDTKGWTQETLAELAGVNVRTVQRLEEGQGASADTLRAVARAIEAKDLGFLLRPQGFPTAAGLKRQAEAFERENMLLDARPIAGGRDLDGFMSAINMLSCVDGDVPDGNDEVLAEAAVLFDDPRDYLDMKSKISHQDRRGVIGGFDAMLSRLRGAGFSPVVAIRDAALTSDRWIDKTPWKVKIGYVTVLASGQTPAKMAVARRFSLE
jgi:transcriptional regulator with XRE-family HTH domain